MSPTRESWGNWQDLEPGKKCKFLDAVLNETVKRQAQSGLRGSPPLTSDACEDGVDYKADLVGYERSPQVKGQPTFMSGFIRALKTRLTTPGLVRSQENTVGNQEKEVG